MKKLNCGDVVIANGIAFRIVGIYLGAMGQQNIVGLSPMTYKPATHPARLGNSDSGPVYPPSPVVEMLVPEELVLAAKVYREVN